jgi:hypothetical protein
MSIKRSLSLLLRKSSSYNTFPSISISTSGKKESNENIDKRHCISNLSTIIENYSELSELNCCCKVHGKTKMLKGIYLKPNNCSCFCRNILQDDMTISCCCIRNST